jgi:predicted AlkP superfamily pyrophosphatase or phosphodiesterase
MPSIFSKKTDYENNPLHHTMKNILLSTLTLSLFLNIAFAQKKIETQPKLVVGIVVDQMRYDYLYRFANKYTNGGFKRLMNDGYNCKNNHYNYALTVTAAGHAAVYTGSVPAINGIVGNEWYSTSLGRVVYCVEDTTVQTVGSNSKKPGQMSPRNLHTTTVTDQLRLASNFQSKVIGIAIKDRGAILPAGHSANAAYWFDSKEGAFITSTYYMNDSPQWVKDFNAQKLPAKYLAQNWNTLLPIEQYTESTADDKPYESKFAGEAKPVFPHELASRAGDVFGNLATTPYGNSLTKDFALAALKNENMGKGNVTDFLCVSFSSTDYVGHAFGPNSIEEDTYIRLDRDIEQMLNTFDATVGKGNYLVFLTADHGVMDVPGFWQENKLPAGLLDLHKIKKAAKEALITAYGEGDYLRAEENYQLYLNKNTLAEKKLTIEDILRVVRPVLLQQAGIADVIDLTNLGKSALNDYQLSLYKNVYNPQRSGDIGLVTAPGWFAGRTTGTTHGTPYSYDTHVPFLLYGWHIPHGETSKRTSISDIAPTIANLLNILHPNGCVGNPVGF